MPSVPTTTMCQQQTLTQVGIVLNWLEIRKTEVSLPALGAVHQAHVEEGREDEVEGGDGGGADQVDDCAEERSGEPDGKQGGDHRATEDNSLPAEGCKEWKLERVSLF